MTHEFDKDYWQTHWRQRMEAGGSGEIAPNPYVARETGGLPPGTALDAGCGAGAEAIWLATAGWSVTAADISAEALARAAERAARSGAPVGNPQWIEADLGSWEPDRRFDLVMTHYAHPAVPQLDFYQRISQWVAPGGTLLIVGHLHTAATTAQGHHHWHGDPAAQPPEKASVTASSITALLDDARWQVVTAAEPSRTVPTPDGTNNELHDVVVRATRLRRAVTVDL